MVLVLAGKLLLVPLLAYMLTSALGGNADLATLAFIIGAFPVGACVVWGGVLPNKYSVDI